MMCHPIRNWLYLSHCFSLVYVLWLFLAASPVLSSRVSIVFPSCFPRVSSSYASKCVVSLVFPLSFTHPFSLSLSLSLLPSPLRSRAFSPFLTFTHPHAVSFSISFLLPLLLALSFSPSPSRVPLLSPRLSLSLPLHVIVVALSCTRCPYVVTQFLPSVFAVDLSCSLLLSLEIVKPLERQLQKS